MRGWPLCRLSSIKVSRKVWRSSSKVVGSSGKLESSCSRIWRELVEGYSRRSRIVSRYSAMSSTAALAQDQICFGEGSSKSARGKFFELLIMSQIVGLHLRFNFTYSQLEKCK